MTKAQGAKTSEAGAGAEKVVMTYNRNVDDHRAFDRSSGIEPRQWGGADVNAATDIKSAAQKVRVSYPPG